MNPVHTDAAPDAAADDAGVAPRPRPGHRTPPKAPLWWVMQAWAPVAAGVLRSTAGLIMFAASLLTLPMTMATPLLSGVSLVMLVGGVAATSRSCRDDDRLRGFGRWFPVIASGTAGVVVVVAVVCGPGAFAPDLGGQPAPPARDDGTIRFVTP
jgi:hypothetical protein